MKTYVVGNFKMNFTVGEASIYLHKIQRKLPAYRDVEVVVAPPMLALQSLSLQVDRHKIKLAAQNGFYRDFGTYTGEVSFAQMVGLVDYAIIGHSERRYIFGEDDKMIAKKVEAAIRNKITPILCVGETESERAFNETGDVIRDQLLSGLSNVSEDELRALKTGFRAPYIKDAVDKAASGIITEEKLLAMTYEEKMETLKTIKGIGDKVANCVILYSLGDREAFPVDVWVRRIMAELYPEGLPECTDGVQGIAQQYLFHWRRNVENPFEA